MPEVSAVHEETQQTEKSGISSFSPGKKMDAEVGVDSNRRGREGGKESGELMKNTDETGGKRESVYVLFICKGSQKPSTNTIRERACVKGGKERERTHPQLKS